MVDICTSIINLRYPAGSVGSATNPERFNPDQDYDDLQKDYLSRGKLFVDKTFQPNSFTLGDLDALTSYQEAQVKWRRPKEILEMLRINNEPVFSSGGTSRFDFGQGLVGNCWLLAAISSLTLNKRLMVQVVPDQSFDNYAGIFHFRFWRFGKWVDVVIDDYLPTFRNEFLSVHAKHTNEFWVPLLEKAYAKLCGSYADMHAGMTGEACKDLTGGLSLTFPLQQVHDDGHDEQLWKALSFGAGCKSMMCCATPSVDEGRIVNTIRDNGLVNSHAYCVTGITEVWHKASKVKLVRLLNPWGKQEWMGNWSDRSSLWNELSKEDRAKVEKAENGEFWIDLEEFCRNFNAFSICCENPNFMDGDLSCQWQLMMQDGAWTTAGGNRNCTTFYTNPQFRIKVDLRNEAEQYDMNVFVSLMQKPSQRNRNKARYHPIAMNIFQVPPETSAGRLGKNFFRRNRPLKTNTPYNTAREVTEWYSLSPGEYVIVPSTMHQYMRTEFVLQVYTKSDLKIHPFEAEEDEQDLGEDLEENLILPEIRTDNGGSEAKEIFDHYANWRGELNARQLQKLLNDQFSHGMWDGFGLDTCMNIISLMDTDNRKRMMDFMEFSELWKKIKKYQQIFEDADINRNGVLNQDELHRAIQAAGTPTSDGWVDMAMFRFTFGATTMYLQSFLALMIRLDQITAFFNRKASGGNLTLSMDDWLMNSTFF